MPASAFLLFALNHRCYGIAAAAVQEIIPLPAVHESLELPPDVVGVVNLRGQFLPLVDLSHRLGQGNHPYAMTDSVIVLAQGDRSLEILALGILVSQVFDVVMLPEPESDRSPKHSEGLTLGITQWQETIVTILNQEALLAIAQAAPTSTHVSFFPAATTADQAQLQARAARLSIVTTPEDTQSLLPLAVIQIGSDRLAIPVETIREFTPVRRVTPIPCCPAHILGNMNLRGEILTLLDIRQVLQLSTMTLSALTQTVVIEVDGIVAGIAINGVFDVMYVPSTAIAPLPVAAYSGRDEYLRGMVIWQNQAVSLLDVAKLLTSSALVVNAFV
jgi:purine-binding chemotaxis protein CheW